jgi:hypothetical protein
MQALDTLAAVAGAAVSPKATAYDQHNAAPAVAAQRRPSAT